jgi:hypothetical protein
VPKATRSSGCAVMYLGPMRTVNITTVQPRAVYSLNASLS